MILHRFWMGTG